MSATTTLPPPVATPEATPAVGQHLVLHAVDWDTYDRFAAAADGLPGVRLTYDGHALEFRMISLPHERYKTLLARLVEATTEELGWEVVGVGQTTWRRKAVAGGLEPDAGFYVQSVERLQSTLRVDLERDPPPDLAIEVEVSRSVLDRLNIYARLKVPEVWRFDGERLTVMVLQADGRYAESAVSQAFPALPLDGVLRVLRQAATAVGDNALVREYRAWLRRDVLPNWPAGGGTPAAPPHAPPP